MISFQPQNPKNLGVGEITATSWMERVVGIIMIGMLRETWYELPGKVVVGEGYGSKWSEMYWGLRAVFIVWV